MVKTGSSEIRLRSDAGTLVPVYISANSLQLDELQSLSIVVTDLTEHKHNEELIAARRVEQLLREQSELARRHVAEILESITDSFIALDREWRFTDLNHVASTTVFGRSRKEILGRVFWESYPEAVDADFYRQFHKAVAEGHPVHFEASYSVAQGKWFETHAYPSPDGLSVYMRDITERKEAEEALQKNEELLRTLVQNLPNGSINVFDKDLRYLFAAGQGLAEVGLSTENLVGKTLDEVFPQESVNKVAPYYRQTFAGNCVEFELNMPTTGTASTLLPCEATSRYTPLLPSRKTSLHESALKRSERSCSQANMQLGPRPRGRIA